MVDKAGNKKSGIEAVGLDELHVKRRRFVFAIIASKGIVIEIQAG